MRVGSACTFDVLPGPDARLTVRRLRRVSAILIAAGVLTTSTTAFASSPVYINDMFRTNLQHPRTLALWASDALIHLRWSRWGSISATATGQITEHGLRVTGPRCAGELGREGYGWRCFAARVNASGIRNCGGHRVYANIRYFAFGHWHTTRFQRNGCSVAAW
jgi:hypothetical protein